jgi:hypothetical protein
MLAVVVVVVAPRGTVVKLMFHPLTFFHDVDLSRASSDVPTDSNTWTEMTAPTVQQGGGTTTRSTTHVVRQFKWALYT